MSKNFIAENYIAGTQSFAAGFLGPMSDVGYTMVFSMRHAKSIAKNEINIRRIEAGLDGDWDCNSCTIFDEDGWHDYDSYDHSRWAKPIIIISFDDGRPPMAFECWTKRS